jgi:hypothetical protein
MVIQHNEPARRKYIDLVSIKQAGSGTGRTVSCCKKPYDHLRVRFKRNTPTYRGVSFISWLFVLYLLEGIFQAGRNLYPYTRFMLRWMARFDFVIRDLRRLNNSFSMVTRPSCQPVIFLAGTPVFNN